jgi:urease accessory protein
LSGAALPDTDAVRGWHAGIRLGLALRGGRTVLAQRERHGPLSVQRPFYPEGGVCHVYLLHPPGGVVGGDVLDIEVSLESGARALVTTPGATKFYRSDGRRALQTQRLRVADGAVLEWLPQESICFPGAEARLATLVELHGSARLAMWDILCLGRPVIDEPFDQGTLDNRLVIERDGVPLLIDRLRVRPDNRDRLSLMAGLPVAGTLVISGAGEEAITACRDLLLAEAGDYAGATLVEDLLIVRYLGGSTERARRMFTRVWQALRPPGIDSPAVPRIWAT